MRSCAKVYDNDNDNDKHSDTSSPILSPPFSAHPTYVTGRPFFFLHSCGILCFLFFWGSHDRWWPGFCGYVVLGPGHGCLQARLISLCFQQVPVWDSSNRECSVARGEAVSGWDPVLLAALLTCTDTAPEVFPLLPPEGAGDVGWPQACSPLDLKAKVRLTGQG